MTKTISLKETEGGHKYFHIYEIIVKSHDGEISVYDRYLDKDEAEETAKLVESTLSERYQYAWVTRQIVWC